jgi:hypothetical protein
MEPLGSELALKIRELPLPPIIVVRAPAPLIVTLRFRAIGGRV